MDKCTIVLYNIENDKFLNVLQSGNIELIYF